MKVGSLFTGYGGLDRSARTVFGGELAWVSDNHPSAVKLLAHRHSDVPNLGDITAIDWDQVEPVDLLTAGFPCQDISNAGKRAGIEGARSGLWSHVADAVRVLRPRHVCLENVSALVVRGLDRVVADLAEVGYDLRWTCLRASDVGAPHRRERWFGYATPQDPDCATGGERRLAAPGQAQSGWARADARGRGGASASHSDRGGQSWFKKCDREPDGAGQGAQRVDSHGHLLDWGRYGPAIRRWEAILGRSAPEPTQPGSRGNRVLSPRFVEWDMGVEPGWVTEVPGLSRNDMLRLLGNGVVPQQGEAAYRWLVGVEALRGVA